MARPGKATSRQKVRAAEKLMNKYGYSRKKASDMIDRASRQRQSNIAAKKKRKK